MFKTVNSPVPSVRSLPVEPANADTIVQSFAEDGNASYRKTIQKSPLPEPYYYAKIDITPKSSVPETTNGLVSFISPIEIEIKNSTVTNDLADITPDGKGIYLSPGYIYELEVCLNLAFSCLQSSQPATLKTILRKHQNGNLIPGQCEGIHIGSASFSSVPGPEYINMTSTILQASVVVAVPATTTDFSVELYYDASPSTDGQAVWSWDSYSYITVKTVSRI